MKMGIGALGSSVITFGRKWRYAFSAEFHDVTVPECFIKVSSRPVLDGPGELSLVYHELSPGLLDSLGNVVVNYAKDLQSGVGKFNWYHGDGSLRETWDLHGLTPGVVNFSAMGSEEKVLEVDWLYTVAKYKSHFSLPPCPAWRPKTAGSLFG